MTDRRDALLPGVSEQAAPPVMVFDPTPTIRTARRRAAIHDLTDFLVLFGVDVFFETWPRAQVPFMTRHQSMTLLIAINLLFGAYVVVVRKLPEWKARRIARTWCEEEQVRLTRARRA